MSSPTPTAAQLAVVIPSRDSRELTLACLRSLAAGATDGSQGVEGGIEVVVVDDASQDGTPRAIEKDFPGVQIVRSEQPRGFTVSANRGLRRATADLLLLLNSDTEVQPGSLAALIEAFERDPELGIAGGTLHYPDGSPQWSGGREPSLLWLFALASGLPRLLARLPGYRKLRPLRPHRTLGPQTGSTPEPPPVDWVTGAALALRREVWTRIGPLDESFRFYCQDLDLCRRAARDGWKIEILPGFRVLHHHGATIGRRAGAQERQHPELLWTDLVDWAAKHRGPRWARRARRALQAGGRLRLWGRALAGLFVPRADRKGWKKDGEAFRRALRALRALRAHREGTSATLL